MIRAVRLKDGREEDPKDESEGPVQFRHDIKLLIPSPIYHTNEQVIRYILFSLYLFSQHIAELIGLVYLIHECDSMQNTIDPWR